VDCYAVKKGICPSCDKKVAVATGIGECCSNKDCVRIDGLIGPAPAPGDEGFGVTPSGWGFRNIVCPVCLKDMETTKPLGAPGTTNYRWVHSCTADEYACPVSTSTERFAPSVKPPHPDDGKRHLKRARQDMFLPVEGWHNDDEWVFMECGHPKTALVFSFAPGWKETYCTWCADVDATPRQLFWFYEQRVRHGIALGGKKGEWTVRLAALTFHYKNLGEGIEDLKRMVRK